MVAGVRVHERCDGVTAIGAERSVVIMRMTLIAKIARSLATLRALSAPCEPSFRTTTQGIRADAQSVL